jgi:cytochrome c
MKLLTITVIASAVASHALAAEPDPARGQQVFNACAACHALEPDKNMTGRSLSGMWGRPAGTLASFPRFSEALKSSGVVWDDTTLDAWLADPQAFIPDNHMIFAGIPDEQARADLLAFLREATEPGVEIAQADDMGMGMDGMMSNEVPNLKTLPPNVQVTEITYCPDTYKVTTADGETTDFLGTQSPLQDRFKRR